MLEQHRDQCIVLFKHQSAETTPYNVLEEAIVTHATDETAERYRDVLTSKQVNHDYPFINAATLRYLRHKGEGPASFVINGKVLYRRSEIERWLAEQEAATTRGGAA